MNIKIQKQCHLKQGLPLQNPEISVRLCFIPKKYHDYDFSYFGPKNITFENIQTQKYFGLTSPYVHVQSAAPPLGKCFCCYPEASFCTIQKALDFIRLPHALSCRQHMLVLELVVKRDCKLQVPLTTLLHRYENQIDLLIFIPFQ